MDKQHRAELAQRLSSLSLRQAIREVRALDRAADLKYWRNSRWDEYHTTFELPNHQLRITLVEHVQMQESDREIGGGPDGSKAQDADYTYVEARVEPFAPRS